MAASLEIPDDTMHDWDFLSAEFNLDDLAVEQSEELNEEQDNDNGDENQQLKGAEESSIVPAGSDSEDDEDDEEEDDETTMTPKMLIPFPSTLLKKHKQNHKHGDPPITITMALLLTYNHEVIKNDYKAIIEWGLCHGSAWNSDRGLRNIIKMLQVWWCVCGSSFRKKLGKELLERARYNNYDFRVKTWIIRALPILQHDLIRVDLIYMYALFRSRQRREFMHGAFKNLLMEVYDFSDCIDPPSLAFVFWRSLLQSIKSSRHFNPFIKEKDIFALIHWLQAFEKSDDDQEACRRDKPAMLRELLQNATLDILDKSLVGKLSNSVSGAFHWRRLLKLLLAVEDEHDYQPIFTVEDGNNNNQDGSLRRDEDLLLLKQNWDHPQHPLHLLLTRGLPGYDLLLKVDIDNHRAYDDAASGASAPAVASCPVFGLYPFQLAAMKKKQTAAHRSDNDDKRRRRARIQLELEPFELSEVYTLMRIKPELVVESHNPDLHSLSYDEEYLALLKQEDGKAGENLDEQMAEVETLEQDAQQIKQMIALYQQDLKRNEQKQERMKRKIAIKEAHRVLKRRCIDRVTAKLDNKEHRQGG